MNMTQKMKREALIQVLEDLNFQADGETLTELQPPNAWTFGFGSSMMTVHVEDLLVVWNTHGVDGVRGHLDIRFNQFIAITMGMLFSMSKNFWNVTRDLQEDNA